MLSKFVLLNRVLDSLRDGSFLKRVISYFTYRDTIVRMQMNLENLPKMIELNPLYDIREVNTADEQDIIHWIDVVNDGYGEGEGGGNDPGRHFNKHIFLENIKAYFITYEGTPIATISIGNYKSKKNWGGDARIAVRGEFQRQGLGRFIILYGFHKLKEQGIMLAETMITVKRKLSIVLHFRCGFKLQKDASEWKYKDYSFFINRIIANHRVEKMLDEYENKKVLWNLRKKSAQ